MLLYLAIPIITVPKNGQLYTLTEGDNITCTATGYPVPDLDIVWLNNDESNNRLVTDSLVADNDSVSVSLTIRRSDTGIYSCVANNSVGNIIHAINVTVQCKLKFFCNYYTGKNADIFHSACTAGRVQKYISY